MNRNLLPLTLFGVGFLMLYSGYKGYHPIEGVLKPVLQGKKPHGDTTATTTAPIPVDPTPANPKYPDAPQQPVNPPVDTAGGWSSSGGQGISA